MNMTDYKINTDGTVEIKVDGTNFTVYPSYSSSSTGSTSCIPLEDWDKVGYSVYNTTSAPVSVSFEVEERKTQQEFEEALDAVRDEYERKLDTIKEALNKHPRCAFCAHYNEEIKICDVTGKPGNLCYQIKPNNFVNKFANL